MSKRPPSEFNGPGYANEPDSKDPRVVRLAAWLKSVNPNELADQFHTELAQIQIGEFLTAGLHVSLEDPSCSTIKSTTDHGIHGSLRYRVDNSQHNT